MWIFGVFVFVVDMVFILFENVWWKLLGLSIYRLYLFLLVVNMFYVLLSILLGLIV